VVLTGLNLVRAAAVALLSSLLIVPLLLCVAATPLARVAWLGIAILGLLGVYLLAALVAFFIGIGVCCRAPADAGARRYVQASFALSIAAALLTAMMLAFEFAVLPAVLQRFLEAIMRSNHFMGLLVLMLLLSAIMAVVCWHRFLAAVATVFDQQALWANAANFVVWFCLWAACCSVPIWFSVQFGFGDGGVVSICGLSLMAPFFLLWAMGLLFEVRNAVHYRLQRKTLDVSPPPPLFVEESAPATRPRLD
jgi:hypothetical protein